MSTQSGINRINGSDAAWLALLLVSMTVVLWGAFSSPPVPFADWQGPLGISVFGVFLVLDVLFAFYLYERWLRVFDFDVTRMLWTGVITVAVGLTTSHLFSVVAYFPDATDLATLLDLRTGMSSFGGIVGGGVAAVGALHWLGLPVRAGLDAMAYGFVGGYVFGRAGCAAIHDHPGTATDAVLGVEINGVVRHDLGMYEMFLMATILLLMQGLARHRQPPAGSVVGMFFLVYAPIRFGLDFLRIEDVRYAALTPGQWSAFLLLGAGIYLVASARVAGQR